jgi:hypothetical protein
VTSAWLPKEGKERDGGGRLPIKGFSAGTAERRCGRGAEKMLNTSAIFMLSFCLPKTLLGSTNIAFKGKRDLSAKAVAPNLLTLLVA